MAPQAVITNNRTVVLTQANQLTVQNYPPPNCPSDGALIKLLVCGLCGSDVEKIKNGNGNATFGHEVIGEIIELGEGALSGATIKFQVGDKVAVAHHIPCQNCSFCHSNHPSMCQQFKKTNIIPGGFSDVIALSSLHLDHTTFLIKKTTPINQAVLIEPLACCIRAADRLNQTMLAYRGKKSVTIIGLGFIGLLCALVFQKRGFDVYGIDINSERVELAKKLGWVITATTSNTPTQKSDAALLTLCTDSTFKTALEVVNDGGTILLFAGYTAPPIIDQDQIYHRELTLTSSYSPSLLSLQESNDWIQNQTLQNLSLFVQQFSTVNLDTIQEGLERYRAGQVIKVLITP